MMYAISYKGVGVTAGPMPDGPMCDSGLRAAAALRALNASFSARVNLERVLKIVVGDVELIDEPLILRIDNIDRCPWSRGRNWG